MATIRQEEVPPSGGATAGGRMLRYLKPTTAIILALSIGVFLLHVIVDAVNPCGYVRDEFYYITCSKHLAFGYVDHPPGCRWSRA